LSFFVLLYIELVVPSRLL